LALWKPHRKGLRHGKGLLTAPQAPLFSVQRERAQIVRRALEMVERVTLWPRPILVHCLLASVAAFDGLGALMRHQTGRRPMLIAWRALPGRQRQSKVARERSIAGLVHSFTGSESGQTTVESWRSVKDRQAERRVQEDGTLAHGNAAGSSTRVYSLLRNILIK
jgi:hypothetical protein